MTKNVKTKISIWQSIKSNIKYSLSVSSISGVSYTSYDAKRSRFERVFWISVVITMMALATWQGLIVYTHYRDRPVIVTVDKAYFDWELIFPTVTICLDNLKSQKELMPIIENFVQKYNLSEDLLFSEYNAFVEYLKNLAFKNYTNYEDYEPYATGEKKEYLQPHQYMDVLDQVVFTLDMDDTKSGRKKLLPLQFPFNELKPVNRIFTEWGPCMVANPNISIYYTPKFFNSTEPYQDYKPTIYSVNTMASMLVKSSTNLYVHLHAPNEVMDIMDRKIFIQRNFYKFSRYESQIVLVTEDVMPLSVIQKKCRLPYEPDEQPLRHSPVYSFNLCKFECRIKIALRHCNCTPYFYRRLPNEPICNLTGLYCLSKHKAQLLYLTNKTEECPICPQNCNVSIYRESQELTNTKFIQTILELFMKFPNEVYVRHLIFTKTDLTVQIGGIFGLFMGCSLLSLVEVIYSVSLRLFCGVRNRNN